MRCEQTRMTLEDVPDVYACENLWSGSNRGPIGHLEQYITTYGGAGQIVRDTQTLICGSAPLVAFCLYDIDQANRVLVLRDLLVNPRRRRLKVASTMLRTLEAALQQAGSLRAIEARINEENLPAQMLFKSLHWPCTRVIHDHWREGAHAYLFRKECTTITVPGNTAEGQAEAQTA